MENFIFSGHHHHANVGHHRHPWSVVVGESRLNNIDRSAVHIVKLINTWYQAVLSNGFVDYSKNGDKKEVTHTVTQGGL